MTGKQPDIIRVFRIVHINNVEHLLLHGITSKFHPKADPNYINIGDSVLINQRYSYPVPIDPPNGFLGEYVPFYFGTLSPMLLNIKSGYRGITKRPQEDIVYIVCRVNTILEHCKEWCFTDGHAKNSITTFYNSLESLNKVDWNMVWEKYWKNTDEDFDRMRRKQAEFLVKHYVPANCINGIAVLNEDKKAIVEKIIKRIGSTSTVSVNPKNIFYY